METHGEAFQYEEIGGVRYALWTAEPEPVDAAQLMGWADFAKYVAGVAAFGVAKWAFIFLAVFGRWSILTVALLLSALMALMLTLVFLWSFGLRKKRMAAIYRRWLARNPDATGVPCVLSTSNWCTSGRDFGAVAFHGSSVVFRGERCDCLFSSRDAVPDRRKGVLRFSHTGPFGKRNTLVVLGGPSSDGWVSKRKALRAAAADLEAWRTYLAPTVTPASHDDQRARRAGPTPARGEELILGSKTPGSERLTEPTHEGSQNNQDESAAGPSRDHERSIYPPLRNSEIRFARGFLTVTVPVAFGVLLIVAVATDLPRFVLFGPFLPHPPSEYVLSYLLTTAVVYGVYVLAIACGYGVQHWRRAQNRKIDLLAIAEQPAS